MMAVREVVVLTHLHPDRYRMRVSGGFEAFERDARLLGHRCLTLPYRDMDVEAALGHLPALPGAVAYLNSGIVSPTFYAAISAALRDREITMFNTAEQNQLLMRFDRFYPVLSELTARSAVIRNPADVSAALDRIPLPAFAKGSVISAKEHGWGACIVEDAAAVRDRAAALTAGEILVLRQLLPLRRTGISGDFPTSREYRFYLLNGEQLGGGYFWEGVDPLGELSGSELADACALAREAAVRLACPLVAVDVGQIDDGSWRVIEVGDPQHTGVMHMSRSAFIAGLQACA